MKIAFCLPDMIIGGIESVFVRTLTNLIDYVQNTPKYKDAEICVITHARITETIYKDWFDKHPSVKVYTFYPLQNFFEGLKPHTNFPVIRQIRKICFSLYKLFKRRILKNRFSDVDVFIDYKNCAFFKELRDYKQRKITWIHGSIGYLQANNIVGRLSMYNNIVGLTNAFVSDFRQQFPDLADRVTRIYNPINVQDIINMSKGAQTGKGKYFCHVSRLERDQKDLDTLLLAFDKFCAKNDARDISLVIVGGGAYEKELKQFAASLSCGNQIVFTGILKNPFGYMKNAVANMLSSKSEGLPTVLIESMALGTLCVASDCKYGPREILLDGKAGVLFKIGDVEQLSQIMADIYLNRLDVNSMIKQASKSLDRFSPSVISKQIMDLIWE